MELCGGVFFFTTDSGTFILSVTPSTQGHSFLPVATMTQGRFLLPVTSLRQGHFFIFSDTTN